MKLIASNYYMQMILKCTSTVTNHPTSILNHASLLLITAAMVHKKKYLL